MAVTEMLGLISVVLGFAGVAGGLIFAFYKIRVSMHQTIRKIVEEGATVSGELVHTLTNFGRSKPVYLRRGVLLVSLGLAILFSMMFINAPDSDAPAIMALSAFPFFVGAGYLLLWWVTPEAD